MKNVLIIFGGNSSEHDVSCKSAKSIAENIDQSLFSYEMVGITRDNQWYQYQDDLKYLEKGTWLEGKKIEIIHPINFLKQFDVVFPIIHGTNGEDGKLQGMMELFNIPFVGCKTLSSAIGMDKEISKIMFDSINISQVPYLVIDEDFEINEIIQKIEFPMIIKPANGGSSIGISKAETKEELEQAILEAKKYDHKIIIEKFIHCRELECAVLEKDQQLICSSPGEVIASNEFYDYDAKYINQKSITKIPTDLPIEIVDKIKENAKIVFKRLQCRGYARVDFFYDSKEQKIYINEINTIPGFTSISMYPTLIENEHISYQELITILIENAL